MYREQDVEWLRICTNLRASGMPLATVRRYADLVRQGNGNESQRLALLREHREQVTNQLSRLTACLDLISYKIKIYEDRLAHGTADQLWNASRVSGVS